MLASPKPVRWEARREFVDPEIPDIVQVLVKAISPTVKMLSRRSTFGVRLLNLPGTGVQLQPEDAEVGMKTNYLRGIVHGKCSKRKFRN
jgi:hypothetical protein